MVQIADETTPIVNRAEVEQHLENIEAWKAALYHHLAEAEKTMIVYTTHVMEAAAIAARLKHAGCRIDNLDIKVSIQPRSRRRGKGSRNQETAGLSS